MKRKEYPPQDGTAELTRQVEMLMQGLSVAEGSPTGSSSDLPKGKRRTLDDMRRLSDHIKAVPVYRRK